MSYRLSSPPSEDLEGDVGAGLSIRQGVVMVIQPIAYVPSDFV